MTEMQCSEGNEALKTTLTQLIHESRVQEGYVSTHSIHDKDCNQQQNTLFTSHSQRPEDFSQQSEPLHPKQGGQ